MKSNIQSSSEDRFNIIEDNLVEDLSGQFEFSRNHMLNGREVPVFGSLHSTRSTPMISNRLGVWNDEFNEFVFIYRFNKLTRDDYSGLFDYIKSCEPYLVKLNKDHTLTNLTLFIITDNPDNEVINGVRRSRFVKSYSFGVYGKCAAQVLLIDAVNETVYYNRRGANLRHYQKIIFKC